MARGWESKSVEDQQSLAAESKSDAPRAPLTPEEQRRRQQLDVLRLALESTQRALTAATNQRHRQQLAAAVAELERRIVEKSST